MVTFRRGILDGEKRIHENDDEDNDRKYHSSDGAEMVP